jgi:integrase
MNAATISRCKVRGVVMWRVRWRDAGRVHRKFFTGRDSADAHAAKIRVDSVGARKRLAALTQSEQEQLLQIRDEAARVGRDLASVVGLITSGNGKDNFSPALADVVNELEVAKRNAGRSERYIYQLRHILDKFIAGRERLAVDKIMLADVERFLDVRKLCSRATIRAKLATLLNFSVRRGYRLENPTRRLETISVPHVTPAVFTVAEVKTCLKWFEKKPTGFGWFVLSTFAGLRPEEASATTWADVNFKEGWVKVEAQQSKVRQRRVIYPGKVAMRWLEHAQKRGARLPLGKDGRVYVIQKLRFVLGWKRWKPDVTRHTCASMLLASSGDVAAISAQLGNSPSVLLKHYKALVTRKDAKAFFAIT